MPPTRRRRQTDIEEDIEDEFQVSSDDVASDEENVDEFVSGTRGSQRSERQNLESLDDDALFGFIRTVVCKSLREVISSGAGSSRGPPPSLGRRTSRSSRSSEGSVQRVTTRFNVSYFSSIVERLSEAKREILKDHGFGSLVLFERCPVPLGLASWIADHVDVRSSDIVVDGKSIPFTDQTVFDILELPIGGETIQKSDSEIGKTDFLSAVSLSRVPSVKTFGDILADDSIPDDELVRSFLIVALGTFLCPNSSTYPCSDYLLPLVDIERVGQWDWCKFVHGWLLSQIRKYQRLKQKGLDSVNLGGCLYVLCVVYLDFLSPGPFHRVPYTFPRISVWKGDMIKEYSDLDRIEGHVYGKRPILPFESTCYAQKSAERNEIADFQKVLVDRIPGDLSPRCMEDLTSLYRKHTGAAPHQVRAECVKDIMVDLMQYFYQRAQEDNSSENLQPRNVDNASVAEGLSQGFQNDGGNERDRYSDDFPDGTIPDAPFFNHEVHGQSFHDLASSAAKEAEVERNDGGQVDGNPASTVDIGLGGGNGRSCNVPDAPTAPAGVESSEAAPAGVESSEAAPAADVVVESSAPAGEVHHGGLSGDTEIIENSDDGVDSVLDSSLPTERISLSSDDDANQFEFKKRRLSGSFSGAVSSVANRTRSRQSSSPNIPVAQVSMVDNPESILRKKSAKRLASRNRKSPLCPNVSLGDDVDDSVDVEVIGCGGRVDLGSQGAVKLSTINAKLKARLTGSKGSVHCTGDVDVDVHGPVGGPVVNEVSGAPVSPMVQQPGPETTVSDVDVAVEQPESVDVVVPVDCGQTYHGTSVSDRPSHTDPEIGKINPTQLKEVHGSSKLSSGHLNWDFSGPSFDLGFGSQSQDKEDNNDNVEPEIHVDVAAQSEDVPSAERQPSTAARPPSHSAFQSSSFVSVLNLVDERSSSINKDEPSRTDNFFKSSSSEASVDAGVRQQNFQNQDWYCEPVPLLAVDSQGIIILDPCEQAGTAATGDFLATGNEGTQNTSSSDKDDLGMICLGSSSKGHHPRRKRRIRKPNSYFRDFDMANLCPRFSVSLPEKQAYHCLMFYHLLPEYSTSNIINYGNVYVTYYELGTSLSRLEKCPVHSHVINAFCRKLFKERHPSLSGRHYFFSTVGDFLVGNSGNSSYLSKNCEKCFTFANKCLDFRTSDHLIFPIMHEGHWFVFVAAIRDGYFVFLDSVFDEDDHYQVHARSVIIPNFIKAWNDYVGSDCDFEDFVIHYAPVPKQSKEFWSMHDDGIFVMKFLELWDPYVDMLAQFQSANISDIRVKFVRSMVFCSFNVINTGKELLSNYGAMVSLKHAHLQSASSFMK